LTLHTLRHTALSRMIEHGYNDHVVMAISGHSSTRMLERSTHPTESLKADALDTFSVSAAVTTASQSSEAAGDDLAELRELLGKTGGRQEARTPDLRVANAALSQLS
jgi:Phage integrase family